MSYEGLRCQVQPLQCNGGCCGCGGLHHPEGVQPTATATVTAATAEGKNIFSPRAKSCARKIKFREPSDWYWKGFEDSARDYFDPPITGQTAKRDYKRGWLEAKASEARLNAELRGALP